MVTLNNRRTQTTIAKLPPRSTNKSLTLKFPKMREVERIFVLYGRGSNIVSEITVSTNVDIVNKMAKTRRMQLKKDKFENRRQIVLLQK